MLSSLAGGQVVQYTEAIEGSELVGYIKTRLIGGCTLATSVHYAVTGWADDCRIKLEMHFQVGSRYILSANKQVALNMTPMKQKL